ncbi:hypothetical protein Q1695_004897 [Nippostrongylus brasiliensis]|nr:hypothetical protein Q1695_004897 [Nippostrongylus brasiliensis]
MDPATRRSLDESSPPLVSDRSINQSLRSREGLHSMSSIDKQSRISRIDRMLKQGRSLSRCFYQLLWFLLPL